SARRRHGLRPRTRGGTSARLAQRDVASRHLPSDLLRGSSHLVDGFGGGRMLPARPIAALPLRNTVRRMVPAERSLTSRATARPETTSTTTRCVTAAAEANAVALASRAQRHLPAAWCTESCEPRPPLTRGL